MADRILVTPEEMAATVQRYNSARDTMQQSFQALDTAWDTLSQVWTGSIKATLTAQWVVIAGNVKKSDLAIQRSINGLVKTHNLMVETINQDIQQGGGLAEGSVPPMF